ncbi:biotin synthase BioB (plasmid) [Caballeronia sp. NK8]|nr:biotin synthase BioB [Caballeronia sp. NK8]
MTQQTAAETTSTTTTTTPQPMQRWRVADVVALYDLPFNDLLYRAQTVHRENFDPNAVQLSTLLSIKTGGCEEDCAYCPQSVHHDTGLKAEKLMDVDEVLKAAETAKSNGATRFCMGAAWRNPKDRHLEPIKDMIRGVKAMGLETCVTLGMLEAHQAQGLRDAGLDYYNHNLDTSPEFYGQIISTRTYQDRLDTLEHVRDAGINVCCGGIVGMGESRRERAGLISQLANMEPYPESVPINNLVQVAGTPLTGVEALDRSSSCARSRSRASRCRKRWCVSPPAASRWTKRCRRCALPPARIRSFTATSCSLRVIRKRSGPSLVEPSGPCRA